MCKKNWAQTIRSNHRLHVSCMAHKFIHDKVKLDIMPVPIIIAAYLTNLISGYLTRYEQVCHTIVEWVIIFKEETRSIQNLGVENVCNKRKLQNQHFELLEEISSYFLNTFKMFHFISHKIGLDHISARFQIALLSKLGHWAHLINNLPFLSVA